MMNRRSLLKTGGLAFTAGVTSSALAKVDPSEDSYASGKTFQASKDIEKVSIIVTKPLFCPYHSITTPIDKPRGGSHYYRNEPFDHNPFIIRASGMSGSPVIMDAKGKFIGFMTTFGFDNSRFVFDGNERLTVIVPEGQQLFIDESGKGNLAWKKYNSMMMKQLKFEPISQHPDFWADVEYCTWVEQKYHAKIPGGQFHVLTHDFVETFVNTLIKYGYPKGKVTLDHGWGLFPDGSINSGYGSWYPDPKKFPNFRKTMDMIRNKGFTPGLWIAFPKIHHASTTAKCYPDMLGDWKASGKVYKKTDERWLNPKADIFSYAWEVIERFYQMGVMKFKIDMSYNTKSDMLHIHKELYRAAKLIDKNIEIEFHVPDIFFTKFTDVTRTNDIWMDDKHDWPGRVKTHYEVTYKSSPGRCINLDHIGGNEIGAITEAKFLQHLSMYKSKIGYPLVSILPHHISQKCVDETGRYLWNYHKNGRNIISDFYLKS